MTPVIEVTGLTKRYGGQPVVLVSHFMEEVEELCDRDPRSGADRGAGHVGGAGGFRRGGIPDAIPADGPARRAVGVAVSLFARRPSRRRGPRPRSASLLVLGASSPARVYRSAMALRRRSRPPAEAGWRD
jgi:hypothetical protein